MLTHRYRGLAQVEHLALAHWRHKLSEHLANETKWVWYANIDRIFNLSFTCVLAGELYLGGLGRSAIIPDVNTGAVLMLLPLASAQTDTPTGQGDTHRPESRAEPLWALRLQYFTLILCGSQRRRWREDVLCLGIYQLSVGLTSSSVHWTFPSSGGAAGKSWPQTAKPTSTFSLQTNNPQTPINNKIRLYTTSRSTLLHSRYCLNRFFSPSPWLLGVFFARF